MKSISSILIISMLIFIGCSATSTYFIKHDQSDYNELNEKLKGEKGKMVLMNGDIIVGEDINIGIDSTSWIERGPLTKSVATLEINYFTFINRGNGASAGAGYGFWAGAAAGLVLGITQRDQPGFKGAGEIGAVVLIFTVPLGGVAGAIIGLPIGFIVGGTDKYMLTDSLHYEESDY